MLDYNALNSASLRQSPYPYTVIEDVLDAEKVEQLLQDFPEIAHGGSIPVDEIESGDAFKALLADLESDQFRTFVSNLFSLNLKNFPIMTTVRGMMRKKDGRIHTDSKSKVITVLLYFNKDWQSDAGHLRMLNNGEDIEDYAEEVAPKLGTMIIFKVTDNCWHGHKPVEGKRLSIQMNYLVGDSAFKKFSFIHHLSAKAKKLFS